MMRRWYGDKVSRFCLLLEVLLLFLAEALTEAVRLTDKFKFCGVESVLHLE